MHDSLIVAFWDGVAELLKKEGISEPKARTEIRRYIDDLAQHEAVEPIYHFGEPYAADAIVTRMGFGKSKSGKKAS
jgi:hypothetical protein